VPREAVRMTKMRTFLGGAVALDNLGWHDPQTDRVPCGRCGKPARARRDGGEALCEKCCVDEATVSRIGQGHVWIDGACAICGRPHPLAPGGSIGPS